MRVLSENEVLVMFVNPDGEGTTRKHFGIASNNVKGKGWKRNKGRNRKITIRIYLTEHHHHHHHHHPLPPWIRSM